MSNACKKRQVHISVDDVGRSLRFLAYNRPGNIFDMRFFGKLRDWHFEYGACFTLYCFAQTEQFLLGDIPDAYTQDFYDNAQWLKLGYHGNSSTPFIEETGYQEGYDITDQALACLGAGRTNILRLHSWEASPEQKAYLKEKGIKVLLYPDDDRYGYAQNDTFEQGGLVHRRTNVWYEKMEMINEESLFIGREYVTAFTHEWCFDQQAQRIETSLKLYEDNGYTFDC